MKPPFITGGRRSIGLSELEQRKTGARASAAAQTEDPALTVQLSGPDAEDMARIVAAALDEDKAEDIVSLDIRGKSSVADMLVIASGRSQRHVAALADRLIGKLKDAGASRVRVEGLPNADWVLVDAGDVIVHLFRPEVRSFYQIEKIWASAPAAVA